MKRIDNPGPNYFKGDNNLIFIFIFYSVLIHWLSWRYTGPVCKWVCWGPDRWWGGKETVTESTWRWCT